MLLSGWYLMLRDMLRCRWLSSSWGKWWFAREAWAKEESCGQLPQPQTRAAFLTCLLLGVCLIKWAAIVSSHVRVALFWFPSVSVSVCLSLSVSACLCFCLSLCVSQSLCFSVSLCFYYQHRKDWGNILKEFLILHRGQSSFRESFEKCMRLARALVLFTILRIFHMFLFLLMCKMRELKK